MFLFFLSRQRKEKSDEYNIDNMFLHIETIFFFNKKGLF